FRDQLTRWRRGVPQRTRRRLPRPRRPLLLARRRDQLRRLGPPPVTVSTRERSDPVRRRISGRAALPPGTVVLVASTAAGRGRVRRRGTRRGRGAGVAARSAPRGGRRRAAAGCAD